MLLNKVDTDSKNVRLAYLSEARRRCSISTSLFQVFLPAEMSYRKKRGATEKVCQYSNYKASSPAMGSLIYVKSLDVLT